MTSTRRTELASFVLDLVDFVEEKLREGLADESLRAAAVSEASGAVPLLRDRLREDDAMKTNFMLLLDSQVYDADAAKWWSDLAGMDRAGFERLAADLVKPQGALAMLRVVIEAKAGAA
jgi:hypothetical protein